MPTFSASLGFLWTERPLAQAIVAAKSAGFAAVECHWPYAEPVEEVKAALVQSGLKMLSLNTIRGDVSAGENGLCALPGREAQARESIDQAIQYAVQIDAMAVHVMAGNAAGKAAQASFVENLSYACEQARPHGLNILIEPLNADDAVGYFLRTTTQAEGLIEQVGAENLRLMFDCYHMQIMEGNLCTRIRELLPLIGHIQFAAVPGRGVPNQGEINYPYIFGFLDALGYEQPLGAEYKPLAATEDSLAWMQGY